jgi:hypothetical protein
MSPERSVMITTVLRSHFQRDGLLQDRWLPCFTLARLWDTGLARGLSAPLDLPLRRSALLRHVLSSPGILSEARACLCRNAEFMEASSACEIAASAYNRHYIWPPQLIDSLGAVFRATSGRNQGHRPVHNRALAHSVWGKKLFFEIVRRRPKAGRVRLPRDPFPRPGSIPVPNSSDGLPCRDARHR